MSVGLFGAENFVPLGAENFVPLTILMLEMLSCNQTTLALTPSIRPGAAGLLTDVEYLRVGSST